MLIDHTAVALMKKTGCGLLAAWPGRARLYVYMRTLGRAAFPIFCFLLIEGYLHTKSVRKYAGSLFLFAILSEIPWNLIHADRLLWMPSQNVYFTLLFGLLGIWVLDTVPRVRQRALGLLGLLGISWVFHADYGCIGFACILLMYLLRENRLYQAVLGACVLSPGAILAAPAILLYNGSRGFIHGKGKYLFYAAYPGHMVILWLLQHSFGIW